MGKSHTGLSKVFLGISWLWSIFPSHMPKIGRRSAWWEPTMIWHKTKPQHYELSSLRRRRFYKRASGFNIRINWQEVLNDFFLLTLFFLLFCHKSTKMPNGRFGQLCWNCQFDPDFNGMESSSGFIQWVWDAVKANKFHPQLCWTSTTTLVVNRAHPSCYITKYYRCIL